MSKAKKILLAVIVIIILALVAIDLIGGNYLVTFALSRSSASGADVAPDPVTTDETQKTARENWEQLSKKTEIWLEQVDKEVVSILSDDGLRLEGDIFSADPSSHRWLIGVHGYTGNRKQTYDYARIYHEAGYHILTPDMRTHGESEGEYIGMGWLDRKDMLHWIELIMERDPEAEIVLHGVSMGGATVLMTSGEELPDNVVAVIDDCGYTSVWDVFSDEAAYLFHIPEFPLLYTASAFAKLRAGYTFGEASAISQVKKTTIPILFIHGSEDNFVHTDMVYELYAACPSEKALYIAEGAGHGQSFYLDPERYFDEVFRFLESNDKT